MDQTKQQEELLEARPLDAHQVHSGTVHSSTGHSGSTLSVGPGHLGSGVQQIPIERIAQSPFQVRDFSREQHLEELANSIQALGILQPLLLRVIPDSIPPYELIAGERRLRAAQSLGMSEVPALILELDDLETQQASIVENLQREDINPIEEALAYKRLSQDFTLTQREIAESVGKKRATISNSLRLLQLDPFVIQKLLDGAIAAGHGRALLALDEPQQQRLFARRTISQSLSVHALEKKISAFLTRSEEFEDDEELEKLQRKLDRQREKVSEHLGLEQVALKLDSEGNRRLNLVFETEAGWKRFMKKIRD